MELQASLHKWYLPLFLYTHFAYDFQEEILVPGYVPSRAVAIIPPIRGLSMRLHIYPIW